MNVYVEQDGCISCGLCVSIQPDIFQFNEDGKAEVQCKVEANMEEAAKRAIDSCPVSVIHEK